MLLITCFVFRLIAPMFHVKHAAFNCLTIVSNGTSPKDFLNYLIIR